MAKLAFHRGLSFTVSGDSVLVLSPPLVITDDQLREGLEVIEQSLEEVERGVTGSPSTSADRRQPAVIR